MENQIAKKMDNEIETGLAEGLVGIVMSGPIAWNRVLG